MALSFDLKIYNSILVNTSIISLYLIPFYFFYLWSEKRIHYNAALFSLISVLVLSYFFDYNYKLGGGAFVKLSMLLLDNLYLFYLTSISGIYIFYILCKDNFDNFALTLLIIFGFSASILPQKYFEPMMLIFFYII